MGNFLNLKERLPFKASLSKSLLPKTNLCMKNKIIFNYHPGFCPKPGFKLNSVSGIGHK